MGLVAGASQFLNASALANAQGISAQSPSLLGGLTIGLLDVGRGNAIQGIGLSRSSRALTQSYLNQSQGLANALLSVPAEANSTENLQTKILALRSSLPESALASNLLLQDDGSTAGQSARGTNVNTNA